MNLVVQQLRTPRNLVVLFAPVAAVAVIWAILALGFFGSAQRNAEERLDLARADQASLAADIAAQSELTPPDQIALVESEFDRSIPELISIDEFVRSLHSLADDRTVSIEQVAPLDLTSSPTGNQALPNGVSAIPVSVTGRGVYADVVSFVEALGGSDRLVVIDSITMAADEETVGVVTLELSFRLFTTAEAAVSVDEDPFAIDDEFDDDVDPTSDLVFDEEA